MNQTDAQTASDAPRDIVIGARSRVWQAVSATPGTGLARFLALRHAQVAEFAFQPGDRIWILAYSRRLQQNLQLFAQLQRLAPGAHFVYVSSSACIAATVSGCYGYPRVKQQAADAAQQLLKARVLTLGLVYDALQELPRGANAATSLSQLRAFLLSPAWPDSSATELRLFGIVTRPFANAAEAALHRLYERLQQACGRWPCVLRPLDAMLRMLGIRWYGYTALSNRLWNAKT